MSYWSVDVRRRFPQPRMCIRQQQDQVLPLVAHVILLQREDGLTMSEAFINNIRVGCTVCVL